MVKLARKLCDPVGVTVNVERMDVSDYAFLEQGIFIERKDAASDLASSLKNGRLTGQALAMSELPHPFLIISGKLDWYRQMKYSSGMTVESYVGLLASLNTKYGNLRCFAVDNDSQFIKAVLAIQKHIGKGTKEFTIERFAHTLNRSNPSVGAYYALTGVGEKKAVELSGLMDYGDFIRCCVKGVGCAQDELVRRGGKKSLVNASTIKCLLEMGFEQ